jgi:hypothetical protein
MKLLPSALLAAAMLPALAAPIEPAVATWSDFTRSTDPADKKLVTEIEHMKWFDVCMAWGREARSRKNLRRMYAMQDFLTAESFINGTDLGAVSSKEPAIGMTFCGVLGMLGRPDQVNQTVRTGRHHSQMVYRGRHVYIYTDGEDVNGTVTSIQF